MFLFTFLPFLYVPIVTSSVVLPRSTPSLTDEAREALESAGVDISKPHVRPRQKVDQILAVGDSYTAGIGANGWLDELGRTTCSRYYHAWPMQLKDKDDWIGINGVKPNLTFGACSGNLMKQLRENQLQQGDPVDTWNYTYTPIGKPQIAVLTISGNDALFSKLINDCIFRYWRANKMLGCDQRIDQVEGIIKTADFKKEIMSTYASVIKAGRDAGGAIPTESFQIFVGGYVGLWNHDDKQCDAVYWNVIWWGLTYRQWLTTAMRKRLNDLVDLLNSKIKEAANELESFGVFLVEGYNEGFNGHRFCEPYPHSCIHGYHYQDYNLENGFWSYQSRRFITFPTEGNPAELECHSDLKSTDVDDYDYDNDVVLKNISEVLVPNEEERSKLSAELGPWNVSAGEWDSYDDIFEALSDRGQHDPEKTKDTEDTLYRMFHPKGSSYAHFADKWMDVIKANRDKPQDGTDSANKTKALSIILELDTEENELGWLYFQTNYGEAVGCRAATDSTLKSRALDDQHDKDAVKDIVGVYPGGTRDLGDFWGQDCIYKNDGADAGRLFCLNSSIAGYECQVEPKTGADGAYGCSGRFLRHAVISCEW